MLTFIVPIFVHRALALELRGLPDRPRTRCRHLVNLRTKVPKGATVIAPFRTTSYEIEAVAPLYVVAAPITHVANTKANDPVARWRAVKHWMLTNDARVAALRRDLGDPRRTSLPSVVMERQALLALGGRADRSSPRGAGRKPWQVAPGFPSYTYVPLGGDAYGYYSCARQLASTALHDAPIIPRGSPRDRGGRILAPAGAGQDATARALLVALWAVGLLAALVAQLVPFTRSARSAGRSSRASPSCLCVWSGTPVPTNGSRLPCSSPSCPTW